MVPVCMYTFTGPRAWHFPLLQGLDRAGAEAIGCEFSLLKKKNDGNYVTDDPSFLNNFLISNETHFHFRNVYTIEHHLTGTYFRT
jgi:hypothetical protein